MRKKKSEIKDLNKQSSKKIYYEDYDGLLRFISYFYQIDLVKKIKPKKVLEIGVGNKTTSNYLKQRGINITTCDFDEKLKPDFVADIRNLPFKNNSYDLVMACEIIEHIPWKDIPKALSELQRVSKKNVLISIPYSSAGFELILRVPRTHKITKKGFFSFFFRIPYFFMKMRFDGYHYWEMGRKNYSIKKIRRTFRKYFKIIKEVRPALDHYHHFFVLKKK